MRYFIFGFLFFITVNMQAQSEAAIDKTIRVTGTIILDDDQEPLIGSGYR